MNYEGEFRDFLITQLKEKFQIQDDVNLLFYLFLRFNCVSGKTEICANEFMQFIMHQLYIVDESKGVYFDNQFFTYQWNVENSLYNIFDEWYFMVFEMINSDLNGNTRNLKQERKNILQDITQKANRKIQKYKDSVYKQEILKYFKLQLLNESFLVKILSVPTLPKVQQIEVRLSDEECLERYLDAANFNTTNTKIIAESTIRDYLFKNLGLIEEGLVPMGKEVATQEGRIDILAKDKHGTYVIIELKTEIDKRLIWQCLYYPEVVKKEYPNTNNPRIITVCPIYPDYLLMVLKKLPQVELYQYKIHSTNSKIEMIQISKL